MKPIFNVNPRLSWDDVCYNKSPMALDLLMIHQDKINWELLVKNFDATYILKDNLDKIDSLDKIDRWYWISRNPNAIDILENILKKEKWSRFLRHPKVNSIGLSGNLNAVHLLHQYPSKIDWSALSGNESFEAIKLLENNQHKIDWFNLAGNKNAIHILENNIDKLNQTHIFLSMNYNAIEILRAKPEFISLPYLASNKNPKSAEIFALYIELHQHDIETINFDIMGRNRYAIPILENYVQYIIDWLFVSINPYAIDFIEKHLDKVNWRGLSMNHNAIHLLERYPERINWESVGFNKNALHIFAPLNYQAMKEQMMQFHRELTEYVLNPLRIQRLSRSYEIDFHKLIENYL